MICHLQFVILIGKLTIYLPISHLLIAIHYLYYLILTVCLYMEVNCQIYDKNSVNYIYVAWKKAIRKIWKIPNISHCRLLPYINDRNYIDSILERRCIRFLYNIFNSENQLYTSMIKYSLTNYDSTLGENIRYLMDKYKFNMHQWYGSITLLFNKIDLYITSHTVMEDRCTGLAIRELCSIRDGIDHLLFTSNYKAVCVYILYHCI